MRLGKGGISLLLACRRRFHANVVTAGVVVARFVFVSMVITVVVVVVIVAVSVLIVLLVTLPVLVLLLVFLLLVLLLLLFVFPARESRRRVMTRRGGGQRTRHQTRDAQLYY